MRGPRFDPRDRLLDARVHATLDLHGCTADEARRLVTGIVGATARANPGAVVHVITGKGRGSAGGPVLRGTVAALLKGELAPRVADWSRDVDDGGFLVRVREARRIAARRVRAGRACRTPGRTWACPRPPRRTRRTSVSA